MSGPTKTQHHPKNGSVISTIPVRRSLRTGTREASSEALRTALDMSSDTFFQISPFELRLVDVNQAACVKLGYSYAELLGMRLCEIAPCIEHVGSSAALEKIVRGDVLQMRIRTFYRRKNSSEFPVEATVRRLNDPLDECLIAVARDVGHKKQLDDLSLHAFRDSLTNLPNRAALQRRLRRAIDRCSRPDGRFALMFADIDRFKLLNDGLGHVVGDGALRAVAERLLACIRPADFVARYGGDEFVVLVNDVSCEDDASQVAQRICASVAAPVAIHRQRLTLSVSVGIALSSDSSVPPEQLIHEADQAMYRAKARGGNTHCSPS